MTPEAAKQFLVERVVEQAQHDGVSLSEPERYMLGYSEVNGPSPDPEKVAQFDEQCDSDEYEAKIARLIRRAHQADQRQGQAASWSDALKALSTQDHYILVMVGQAGLKVPIAPGLSVPIALSSPDNRAMLIVFLPWLLPAALFGAGMLVVIDPWGWRLLRSDTWKLAFVAILLATVYALGSFINAWAIRRGVREVSSNKPGSGPPYGT